MPHDDGGLPYIEFWQDSQGRAKDLGEVWALEKAGHRARCVLQGHPMGIEARVLIDGEIYRTEAFKNEKDKNSTVMINETHAWRQAFEAKGWTVQR